MREYAVGAPFDFVAGIAGYEEGGCTASVVVAVETAFDCVVEDVARGYFFGWRERVSWVGDNFEGL